MKDQTVQLVKVLKTSISTLGLSLREVERRLKFSRGYLTRLFGGEMDLKVDHVSEIAEAIGVDPDELFRLAFPPSPKTPTAEVARLREALGVPASPSPPPPDKPSDLERILEQMVNQALEKAFANFISSTKQGTS